MSQQAVLVGVGMSGYRYLIRLRKSLADIDSLQISPVTKSNFSSASINLGIYATGQRKALIAFMWKDRSDDFSHGFFIIHSEYACHLFPNVAMDRSLVPSTSILDWGFNPRGDADLTSTSLVHVEGFARARDLAPDVLPPRGAPPPAAATLTKKPRTSSSPRAQTAHTLPENSARAMRGCRRTSTPPTTIP